MAFKLANILNPQSDPASPAPETHEAIAQGSHSLMGRRDRSLIVAANEILAPVTSTYDAANALTALASSGAPSYGSFYTQSIAPTASIRPYHSPTNSYGGDARPGSSYGTYASPVEPSPPIERMPQPLSSGLHQYHHGSKSPEQQRRESMLHPPDFAATLPPIKLFSHFDESVSEELDHRSTNASYGHDASQMVAGGDSTDINNIAHNREPDYVRDSPTISQIRKPAPTPLATDLPPRNGDRSSFTPQIKDEPVVTPRTSPPHTSPIENLDTDTAIAIAALTNEHGTRGVRAKPTIEMPEPELTATKKRPAPAKVSTKKGVARKPPAKKRKVEDENRAPRSASPTSRPPSKTPTATMRGGAAVKKSKSNTPQLGSSPAPNGGSSPPAEENDDDGEEASDNEVYCICRKPDNHSWMIACDGGCDDWFHGKCVQMKEEMGELIDKYICPNCTRDGRGVTTWKPGCRRPGCNKPADLSSKSQPSKYCSTACGKQFMSEKLGLNTAKHAKDKARRKASSTDNTGNEMDIDDEDDLPLLGRALKPGEVKAMVDAAKNVTEFRKLGEGVLSPPATASPEKSTFDATATVNGDAPAKPTSEIPAPQPPSYTLTPSESLRIQAIGDEKEKLTQRRALFRDREQFVRLVVDQGNKYAEKEGLKPKDVCGYDSRLAWSEPEFDKWRNTKKGKDALETGLFDTDGKKNEINGDNAEHKPQENGTAANGEETNGDAEDIDKGNFCTKKRCEQHKQWQKITAMDVRAELSDMNADRAKLEEEEKEIRQRANLRWRMENSSKGKGGEAQRLEGWVEVVKG